MLTAILNILKSNRYTLYTRPGELNIVGIRSATAKPNCFDDCITVFYTRGNNGWEYKACKATTDPGGFWLKQPLNAKGTAILKPGQYIHSHAVGLHRGKYKALVQVSPVTVYRDNNRDGIANTNGDKEETGLFGINIHHAADDGVTRFSDSYSAGCQVFADIADFNAVMLLADKHCSLYGNRFTYTLLNEKDISR